MFPDVVILAGGLGKRLASVTGGGQKVLAKINGQPFLEILIDYIASQGGQRFILCVGHGSDDVEAYFSSGIKNKYSGLEIIFSKEETPLGTGGAIKQGAAHVQTDTFLAMNGDCFCVIDYNALIAFHHAHQAKATLAVTLMPDAREYGTIEISPHKTIEAFKEKQPELKEAFINTGTYCFSRDVFSLHPVHGDSPLVNNDGGTVPMNKFSIEYDFFPHLVAKGFYAFEVENRFIDIGTPDRYGWAQEHLKQLRHSEAKPKNLNLH